MSAYRYFIKSKAFLAAVLILSVLFSGTVIAEITNTQIQETGGYTAATNAFSIDGGGYAASSVSVPAAGLSLTVTNTNTNGNDKYDSFDLIVMPGSAADLAVLGCDSGTLYEYGITGYKKAPDGALVYTDIECSTGSASVALTNSSASAVSVSIAAVRHTEHNYFVGSMFDFRLSAQEYFHNFGAENIALGGSVTSGTAISDGVYPFIASDDYAYTYIVSSFTVDEAYVYNVPSYIDLLFSDITLGAKLTVNHGYSGVFSVATAGGQIDNSSYVFEISAPNAYYRTEAVNASFAHETGFSIGNIVSTAGNFVKSSTGIDISANATVRAIVLSEASSYIGDYLKATMFAGTGKYYTAKNILLPQEYHNYGITYSYASSVSTVYSVMNGTGIPLRASSTAASALSVSVMYGGSTQAGYGYTHNVSVVGTSSSAKQTAYMDALGSFASGMQPASPTAASDIYARGLDIKAFTDAFVAETGFTDIDGLTIDAQSNLLQFRIAYRDSSEYKFAETDAVVFDYNSTSKEVMAEGYTDTDAIILRHEYYTATATDTVALKNGSTVLANFDASFIGVSIDERNKFIEYSMPQVYISTSDDVNVLNFASSGIYVGTSSGTSPERVLASTLNAKTVSGSKINYSLYYMNEAAKNTLDAIYADYETNSRSAEFLSGVIASLLSNSTTDTDLNAIITAASITGTPACSTTYGASSLDLLGGSSAYFSITDGVLAINGDSNVKVNSGVLTLVGAVQYDDTDSDHASGYTYYVTRQLYSPTEGLGGGDTSLTESKVFYDVFYQTGNWLTYTKDEAKSLDPGSQRVITYLKYTVSYTDSDGASTSYVQTHTVSINSSLAVTGVSSSPSAAPCDYFSIVWDSAAGFFKLDVTPANVPVYNSTVSVTVTVTDGETPVTENYSFIIPGILQYGDEVSDIWVYLRMLQTYGHADGYLLTDSLSASKDKFVCTLASVNKALADNSSSIPVLFDIDINSLVTLGIITSAQRSTAVSRLYSSPVFSLGGVEYIKNTQKLDFTELTVSSLAPFAGSSSPATTAILLNGCGITDDMLCGTDAASSVKYPLYKLQKLISADISDNPGVTSLEKDSSSDTAYIFYRTLQNLSANNCALTSLAGTENLVSLVSIQVEATQFNGSGYSSTNNIKNFDTLLSLSDLTEAYIYGNVMSDSRYGTNGSLNLCNTVALIHRGVSVYTAKSGSTDIAAAIYENNSGTYYLSGSMAPMASAPAASSMYLVQKTGYLIDIEQEYLSVVINAYFNFDDFTVVKPSGGSSITYTTVMNYMFPASIYENTIGTSRLYTVTAVDESPSTAAPSGTTTVTRSYIVTIKYGGSDDYRFKDYYTAGEVASGAYMEVSRELVFDVTIVN